MADIPSLEYIANYLAVEQSKESSGQKAPDPSEIFEEAAASYKQAVEKRAVCKSESDKLFICLSAKSCVDKLLQSYLIFRCGSYEPGKSTSEMLGVCSDLDADFKGIDLACLMCRHTAEHGDTSMHCMSGESSGKCLELAEQVMSVVSGKLKR